MKPPRSQLRTGRRSGSLRIIRTALAAPVSDVIATPARMSVARGSPSELRATTYATVTAARAPTKAAAGSRLTPWKRNNFFA